jgi:histidinol dehydrogenase
MAQVEHDKNAKAFVFCSSKNKIEKLQKVLSPQARKQVVCHVSAIDKAIEKINEIAPEHLELLIKNYKPYLNKIFNAGAIFLGYQTPTSSGDYWAGPSHVLPTNANAKFASGLSVMTFLKRSSIVCMNAKDSKAYKDISNFAQSEGLLWHKKSADIRIK